jgi:hypothetical protein
MLRLRSLGRSLGRSLRRVFSRSSHALASLGRDRARIGRTIEPRIVRPFRPLVRPPFRPLRGSLGDLAGSMPALLVGAGVFLVVAGLFNYFSPAGQPGASPTSEVASGSPSLLSFPSSATPSGSVNPSPDTSGVVTRAVATRVVIPVLLIDLPIVASPLNEKFPLCDAAEYWSQDKVVYGYPGAPQAVYLYAHARVHMFWQLLAKSKVNDGAALVGEYVEVYTDDNQNHIYKITKVIPHVPNSPRAFDEPLAATTDQLWLQTSEGYANSSLKLQVVAMPIGVVAASQADAHPAGRGNVCPDAPLCRAAGQGGCRR